MCSWVNCVHLLPGAPMASTNYPKLRLFLINIPSEWCTTSPWIYPSGTNQMLQSYQLMLGNIRLGPLLMGRICERRIFDLWRTILFVSELAYIFLFVALQEKIDGAVGVERIKNPAMITFINYSVKNIDLVLCFAYDKSILLLFDISNWTKDFIIHLHCLTQTGTSFRQTAFRQISVVVNVLFYGFLFM